jgi:hypothetical protein
MLKRRSNHDELWSVKSKPVLKSANELPDNHKFDNVHNNGNNQFSEWCLVELNKNDEEKNISWYVPTKMGDGVTSDDWYPYVFLETNGDVNKVNSRTRVFAGKRPTNNGDTKNCYLVHANELDCEKDDKIIFSPSTFDFQFLDVAGRRFDICYDEKGRRKGLPRRPYYLEEIEDMKELWKMISNEKDGLTNTQIHALVEEIEKRRERWDVEYCETDNTFKQFVKDALLEAFGKPPNKNLLELEKAAISGMLTDVVELYMKIMKQDSQKKNNTEENR